MVWRFCVGCRVCLGHEEGLVGLKGCARLVPALTWQLGGLKAVEFTLHLQSHKGTSIRGMQPLKGIGRGLRVWGCCVGLRLCWGTIWWALGGGARLLVSGFDLVSRRGSGWDDLCYKDCPWPA